MNYEFQITLMGKHSVANFPFSLERSEYATLAAWLIIIE